MSEIIERNLIKSLVLSYNEDKRKIDMSIENFNNIDKMALSIAFEKHYIASSLNRNEISSIYELMSKSNLYKKLSQKYWHKAFDISQAKNVMPSERISEWNEQIQNGELPEFNIENVFSTVFEFFTGRRKYMAEKADGILKSLSSNHKTNMSDQITEKFIFEDMVFPRSQQVNIKMAEKINDLRSLIRQIRGLDEYSSISSSLMIKHFYFNNTGEWNYIDGNAFRLKIYKKGTAHIELHPEIVEEMSILLSELYPMQISNKKEFTKRKKEFKNYELRKDMISYQVCEIITKKITQYCNPFYEYDFCRKIEDGVQKCKDINNIMALSVCNFEFEGESYNSIPKELIDIFPLLGIKERKYAHFTWFSADYNAIPVLRKIAYQGWIDDYKSYQFYPTKKDLADKLIDYASFETGEEKVLEPSAGQGGLCSVIPVNKENIDCVEISEINKLILTSKGYNIVANEFLSFSQKTKKRYDRIVMNPPFSKGRAKLHVEQAFKLLNENGNVSAIVPASFKDKIIIEGEKHTYSEIFTDNFDNTSVSVVIVRIEKS